MEMYSPNSRTAEPLQIRLSQKEIKEIVLSKYTERAKQIGKEKKYNR